MSLQNEEKIKFLKSASSILIKLTRILDSVEDIDFIKMEQINKDNPYYKAVEFLTEIIDNLDENSRLSEAFINFDSGTILNLLEKNTWSNYTITNAFKEKIEVGDEEYQKEFGLSILNMGQVKLHLKDLLPKLIIRIASHANFRAYYDKDVKIMVINELKVFKNTIESMNYCLQQDDSDKYILPITIEIMHEILSHGKIRIYDKSQISPRFYRDSYENFKIKSIFKEHRIKYNRRVCIPIPESGRVLEHFISDNFDIIRILKIPMIENIIFLHYKFWVANNFDFIENTINQRGNIQNLSSIKIEGDEFEDDSLDDCVIDRS